MSTIAISQGVRRPRRRIARRALAAIATAVMTAIVLVAIFAPWIAPYDPLAIDVAFKLKPPSAAHWFGTDILGRDILSRIIHGARVSLSVGIGVAAFATFFGVCLGIVVGFSRTVDRVIASIMDGMMAIPGILLAIALVAATRPSVATVIFAITVPEIP